MLANPERIEWDHEALSYLIDHEYYYSASADAMDWHHTTYQ